MAWDNALPLVKENLNIRLGVRDDYLKSILDGVITELEDEDGLVLDQANPYHLQFVVDLTAWRYRARGETGGIPRHLQFRFHNLMIHGGDKDV